jgi:hypothetical protein
MTDNGRRQMMYQGRVAIFACLSRLSKTQHDPKSFAINLTLLTVNLEYNLLDKLYAGISP